MKERIDPLSDAIFSIIMTLLVLKIHVPEIDHDLVSEMKLVSEITHLIPEFAIFFFSFAVLGTYWISHNITLGVFAKNFDRVLVMINFAFLAIAGLIPFSAAILAADPGNRLGIIIYSVNILLLTLFLFIIRLYILYSPSIKNPDAGMLKYDSMDAIYANARILINVSFAVLAVIFSFIYTPISFVFLGLPIIFGLVPGSISYVFKLLKLDYARASKIFIFKKRTQ